MLLTLLVLTPILLLVYLELKNLRVKKIINRIPGPQELPLIGNVLQMKNTSEEILNQLMNWWHLYDESNFRLWIGLIPNIFLTNSKDVEFILSSNSLIQKSDLYDMVHPWIGQGLLTSSGAKWHKQRKMITPSFHFKILQDFHEVMNINSTKFIKKLRKLSGNETIFDFQYQANFFTLDVICDTAMGVSINAMDNENSELVKAFKDICENINLRIYNPLKRKNSTYKFFPEYREFKKTLQILEDFTNRIINERKEKLKEEEKNKDSTKTDEFSRKKMAFIDTILTATIDNRPLTKQEIYDEVSTFIFEGHDTTTSGITFMTYLLSRHPEIQRKVYEEQQTILGSRIAEEATFQDIADMKYLDLVVKEAQRIYPSVPMIARCAEKDYMINGTLIPKDTSINLFIFAMGYNEKNFPDPYRCDPDRFNYEKTGNKINPFDYVPFSAGPRNCIGQKFAILEIKSVISKIVRNFEILPPLDELISKDGYVQNYFGLTEAEKLERGLTYKSHKYDPIIAANLTLKSANGVNIRLRERRK